MSAATQSWPPGVSLGSPLLVFQGRYVAAMPFTVWYVPSVIWSLMPIHVRAAAAAVVIACSSARLSGIARYAPSAAQRSRCVAHTCAFTVSLYTCVPAFGSVAYAVGQPIEPSLL